MKSFQSPRSGQICSNASLRKEGRSFPKKFQSPRSGQICSNYISSNHTLVGNRTSFNPLDRVKFVQILLATMNVVHASASHTVSIPQIGSNLFKQVVKSLPEEKESKVSIPQIGSNLFKLEEIVDSLPEERKFQSPRSGQICSNATYLRVLGKISLTPFQSPRSGQICSNTNKLKSLQRRVTTFQSPRSGQICSNSLKDYSRKIKTNKFI